MNMNKLIVAAIGGLAGGVVLSTQVAGPLLAQEEARNASVYEQLDLFGDIFERIRAQYVEAGRDESELIEAAIDGMLSSLDPHSSYLCAGRCSADARADPRRIRRAGHRGHAGGRLRQGRLAYRRHPGDGGRASRRAISSPMSTATALLGLTLDEAVDLMRGPGRLRNPHHRGARGRGRTLRRLDHPRHHSS
jgi:carboxyl-terminal processing protease